MKTSDENSGIKCQKIYRSTQPKSGWVLLVALFLRVATLVLRNSFDSKSIFCVGGLSSFCIKNPLCRERQSTWLSWL